MIKMGLYFNKELLKKSENLWSALDTQTSSNYDNVAVY